jgi:hypothetical protein
MGGKQPRKAVSSAHGVLLYNGVHLLAVTTKSAPERRTFLLTKT